MKYTENRSGKAMTILEPDIRFWCQRYWIPGYEIEDLQQECRLSLWKGLDKYSHLNGALVRTWGNTVIKTRLKELLRNSNYDCRAVSHFSFNDNIEHSECIGDLGDLLDILDENDMTLEDFYKF